MTARRSNEIGPLGMVVASKIRKLRTNRGITTEQLARRMTELGRPMFPNTITKIEKAQRRIDVDDLGALASALGVTIGQLVEPPGLCSSCHGAPPAGFACLACGSDGTQTVTIHLRSEGAKLDQQFTEMLREAIRRSGGGL